MADGPVLPDASLLATTPDPLNMNTPDFTLTPSTASSTAIATPNTLHIPQSSAAKPAKKRKSWGQALPEPKTNLPPRKRAKTADEKEQRRIERIKRNRAAAHNSRERKRQEAERLELENHALKLHINALQRQLAQKDVTLSKCKDMLPDGRLPQLTEADLANIQVPDDSMVSTLSSLDTIDPRASLAPSSTGDYMTPSSVKMEPMSPAAQMHLTPSSTARKGSVSLDMTQHSAAMLCDPQCLSSEMMPLASRWSQIILYLMHLNLMVFYKSMVVALWTLWPTRMARMAVQMSMSTTSSTASSATTTAPTTMSRQTRRLAAKKTPSAPRITTSTTLFSLMASLSQRLPATSATSAQSFATGPERQDVSAQALPFSERSPLAATCPTSTSDSRSVAWSIAWNKEEEQQKLEGGRSDQKHGRTQDSFM